MYAIAASVVDHRLSLIIEEVLGGGCSYYSELRNGQMWERG